MPKRFPLSAVAMVREQKETAEQRALAALHAERHRLSTALAALERQLASLAANRYAERNQTLPAAHFQAVAGHHDMLRAQRAELLQQQIACEARCSEQQVRLLAARRDREMVTQLRENHENRWRAEQELKETKRLDDLFSARHVRSAG